MDKAEPEVDDVTAAERPGDGGDGDVRVLPLQLAHHPRPAAVRELTAKLTVTENGILFDLFTVLGISILIQYM